MATYEVPEKFGGMSLAQIYKSLENAGEYFPSAALAQDLGVGFEQPLQTGQQFSYRDDPGSGGYQFLQKQFAPGGTFATQQAQQQAAGMQQRAQEAVAPAIETLEKGKDPLKQKYNDIIASIKGEKEVAMQQAGVASAQEFGKRGIPLSSGAYSQYLQGRTLPISTAYESQEAQTGLAAQQMEQAIDNMIAQLQAETGMSAFDAENAVNMALMSLKEQQRQFDISTQLSKDQLAQNLEIAKMGKETGSNYVTLGEGSTLYDLLTNQALYTAPKTYKGTSGGGGDTLGLF